MSLAPSPSRTPRTAAPNVSLLRPNPSVPVANAATVETPTGRDEAAAEERRWLVTLLIPFALGATFFAAAIGTGNVLLIGPAILGSVMCLIFAFIYLALTSEAN